MAALCNGGFLDIFDQTQPTNADTAVGAQVKLASLPLSATAFAAAVNGAATANAITTDASADATGTASWFRVFKSDHTTAVWDGSVGTSDADLVLNSVAIQIGAAVSVTSLTLTESKG
jgi:hypothetical protein